MDKVVHFEIPFDDKGRATRFYSDIFGWQLFDIPQMDYVMVHAAKTGPDNMVDEKGAINGGFFPREKEAGVPLVVIGVDSIDETVKKVVAAGGRLVMAKRPIPNGHYARVADCEGNLIGLADSTR